MSYESDLLRDWYLLFHYGTPEEILDGVGFDPASLPNRCLEFPSATVEAAKSEGPVARALDLGCAVGRSAFELSRIADEVVGIDFSESFVAAADAIRSGEAVGYRRYGEMHLPESLAARLPGETNPDRISFERGDAMELREDLGAFDLVHAANLLCRLADPLRLLGRLSSLVTPGGRLVLATPATWLEEFTPAANQPEGPTLDYLRHHLASDFDFVEANELPFLIREHRRKWQLSTSQTSLWIRK
ncbi:MAG: methyltransferase domain-containing protein [Verrucomicrobiales bacterium]